MTACIRHILTGDPGRADEARLQTNHMRSDPRHHLGDAATVSAGEFVSSHRERRPSFSETADSRSPLKIARGRGPSPKETNLGTIAASTGEFAGCTEVERPRVEGAGDGRVAFDTASLGQRTPLSRESNSSRTSYAGHRKRRPSFATSFDNAGDGKPSRKSPRDLRKLLAGTGDSRPPLKIARERRASFRDRNFGAAATATASVVEVTGSHRKCRPYSFSDAGNGQPGSSTIPRDQHRFFSRDCRPAATTSRKRRPSLDEASHRRSPHVTPRERQFSLDETRNRRSPHVTPRERQFSLDETRNRRSPHLTPRERQFSLDETRNRRSPHVTPRERQFSLVEARNRNSPYVTSRE